MTPKHSEQADDVDRGATSEMEILGLEIIEHLNDRLLDEIRNYENLSGTFVAVQAAIVGFTLEQLSTPTWCLAFALICTFGGLLLAMLTLLKRGQAVPDPTTFALVLQTDEPEDVRANLFAAFLASSQKNGSLASAKRRTMLASIILTSAAIFFTVLSREHRSDTVAPIAHRASPKPLQSASTVGGKTEAGKSRLLPSPARTR